MIAIEEANANKNHEICWKQDNELKTIIWWIEIFEEEGERFFNYFIEIILAYNMV